MAVAGIAIALLVLDATLTSPNYDPINAGRSLTGALIVVAGLCLWLLIQVKTFLVIRLTSISYVVTINGRDETFRSRKKASRRIAEVQSSGFLASQVKMRRVETKPLPDGSVSIEEHEIPVEI